MVEFKLANFLEKYSIFILVFFFFAAFAILSIGKHQRFETSAADLGIYAQSVWHYSRFEAPFSSIKNINQLGDHFNPTLALFTPLYWIWPNVISLLIAQSFLVVMGALPIYFFAKEKLGYLAGLVIAFAYLVFPGIQSGIDFNFHPEVVAATWIGFSIYFLIKKQWLWYIFFALLALGSKEDIAPIFVGLGVYLIVIKRHYTVGTLTLIASLVWFYLTTSILMPFSAGTPIHFLELHSKAAGIFSDLFFNQVQFIKTLTQPFAKIETILTLFGSAAFIPLVSPLAWFTTPATFVNRFISDDWSRWSTHFQYSATVAPLLAISTILGIENFTKWLKIKEVKILCLLAIIVGIVYANRPNWDRPFITPPLAQIARKSFWTQTENQKLTHKILKTIPENVSVATNTNYVPYLINRDKIFDFPKVAEQPDIYFLTTYNLFPNETLKVFEKEIQKLKQDSNYELIFEREGILLFKLKFAKI